MKGWRLQEKFYIAFSFHQDELIKKNKMREEQKKIFLRPVICNLLPDHASYPH